MCQLTLVHAKNNTVNSLILFNQMLKNSDFSNRDGYGFMSEYNIYKSERSPEMVSNFSRVIFTRAELDESAGIISGHVRQATSTNGRKEVTAENAHPFDFERFALMHNGSIEYKDILKMKDEKYKGMIDSQIFAHRLNEVWENQRLSEALISTMEEFRGKFAFIIYNKLTDQFLVVRGKTADLHIQEFRYTLNDVPYNGYVINTVKKDLDAMTNLYIQMLLFMGFDDIFFGPTKLLDAETIYLAEDTGLTKINDIKENEKVVVTAVTTYNPHSAAWRGNYSYLNGLDDEDAIIPQPKNVPEKIRSSAELISSFMTDCGMTMFEMDVITKIITGKSIFDLVEKDVENLLLELINLSESSYIVKDWNSKHESWRKICLAYRTEKEAYIQTGLQFPWWINRSRSLTKAERSAEKKAEKNVKDTII